MQFCLYKALTPKKNNLPKSNKVNTSKEEYYSNLSKRSSGFSLIEIMVTISIAGIALTIALPSLGGFLAKMRVDNQITELQRLLLTARNSAINTGQNATLCPLNAAGDSCDGANWAGKIGIITDADGLIKESGAIKSGDELQFKFNSVIYGPDGQLTNNNIDLFSYCPKDYPDYSRGVDISLSGRAYLSSDSDGDGKEEDRNGNAITCD